MYATGHLSLDRNRLGCGVNITIDTPCQSDVLTSQKDVSIDCAVDFNYGAGSYKKAVEDFIFAERHKLLRLGRVSHAKCHDRQHKRNEPNLHS